MIVVVMGGTSSEREISINSGNAVYNSLLKQNIEVKLFDWKEDNTDELLKLKPDKVFIVLHGKGGEDGVLQKILTNNNIPYTGSTALASKNAMDKGKTQSILSQNNLPTAPYLIVQKTEKPQINFSPPFAVKPTTEGSSIGISKANLTNLDKALNLAFQYAPEVLIEKWITGCEFSVPVLSINKKDTALPPVEIKSNAEFYDYQAKYFTDDTTYICPPDIDEKLNQEMQNLALKAFKVLGCKTWSRIDFLLDEKSNKLYILEINTVPGMTNHSLFPISAKQYGLSFDELVLTILNN